MNFCVILLLALDLRVFGFNYQSFVAQDSNNEAVAVYSIVDSDKCPKIKQPLCATNGREFFYFENKCQLEAKNYERLIQGLIEYVECPLSFCEPHCPTCSPVSKPVCAVEVLTGEKRSFRNPCEMERMKCTAKKEWRLISINECNTSASNRLLKRLNAHLRTTDCPEYCSLEYRPICGRFMTLEKEFSNECELRATICQTKQKWDIVRQGPCQTSNYNTVIESYAIDSGCPRPCALDYKPICAKLNDELRVFKNKCELDNIRCLGQDWQIVKHGPCLEGRNGVKRIKCRENCSKEYKPICGQYKGELRQFGNSCELIKSLCESNKRWEVLLYDICPTNTPISLDMPRSCPTFCTKVYKPVCARFKNNIREFKNKCLWESWNCESDKRWEIIKWGPCFTNSNSLLPAQSKCPQFCTSEYKPVCAQLKSKLKEFENKCELQKTVCETNTNWKLVKEGHCPLISDPRKSCPNLCTKEFSPVCASFMGKLRVFDNSCELQKISCETNIPWEIVKMGQCSLSSISVLSDSQPCPSYCSNEYKPICAEFKSELREFKNECEMQKLSCESKTDWQFIKYGHCDLLPDPSSSCTALCTEEFSPVCAKSNDELREFVNNCELQKNACETNTEWELLHNAPCNVNPDGKETSCKNEVLDPICAIDGYRSKTFNNLCQMAEEMRRTVNNWSILHRGICNNTNTSLAAATSSAIAAEETTTKTSCTTSTQERTTAEYKYTTVKQTTMTLKSTKYNYIDQDTKTYESATLTNSSTTKIAESNESSSIETSTNNVNSFKEVSEKLYDYSGQDIVDNNSGSHEESSTNSSFSTESNLSYRENSDNGTYQKWTEEQHNASHSYEAKSYENNNTNHVRISAIEGFPKEDDASDATVLEATSTESPGKNNASEGTVDEYVNKEGIDSSKSKDKYKESEETDKYNNVPLKSREEKNYYKNTIEIKMESEAPIKSDLKYVQEKLKNNSNKEGGLGNKDIVSDKIYNMPSHWITNYLKERILTKWIKKQIQEILGRATNGQSHEESTSNESNFHTSQSIEHFGRDYEVDSNGSSEENTSSGQYNTKVTNNQQMDASFNLTNPNKIKAQDRESYDSKNQSKVIKQTDNKYNNIYESSQVNQNKQTLHRNQYDPEHFKQTATSLTNNNESDLKYYESKKKKEDIESRANENLKTLEDETTLGYSNREEDEQYFSKHNSSKPKKGEIYNGIVYKAPVYDAPTYNFIYTAPFNYHGFGSNYTNPLANHEKNSLGNQTKLASMAKAHFDPFHVLFSLATMSGRLTKPNFMPLPVSTNGEINAPASTPNLHIMNNQSKLATNTMQEKHLTSPVLPKSALDHFVSSLASLNGKFAPQIQRLPSLKQSEGNKNNYQPTENANNHPVPEDYKSAMTALPLTIAKAHVVLPSSPVQSSSLSTVVSQHSTGAQNLSQSLTPVSFHPQMSLNSTLLQQILEILNTLTNRY